MGAKLFQGHYHMEFEHFYLVEKISAKKFLKIIRIIEEIFFPSKKKTAKKVKLFAKLYCSHISGSIGILILRQSHVWVHARMHYRKMANKYDHVRNQGFQH